MHAARKHRPNWGDASFIMRTDPERERKPRLEAGKFELPDCGEFSMPTCLAVWRAIGLINNLDHIREHVEKLERWQTRK
jgi:hypothetical protein